jgi:hypothetical protein
LGDLKVKKWEKFSKEEIEQFVAESTSYSQLSFKLGYGHSENTSGSANKTMQDMIKELSLDASHFKGQGWNKGNFDYSRFTYGKKVKTADALKAIALIRGHKCESCGLEEWQGKQIPLEVHHIDGNDLNSDLSNLQILCPNCHALTDNYKGRNINSGVMVVSDEELVKALNEYPNIRQALMAVGLTGKGGNYIRANELIQKYKIKKYLQ